MMSPSSGATLTDYDAAGYGEAVGDDYDVLYPGVAAETDATVELLATLSRERPERAIVEFGVGTGRIALPLNSRGLRVAGIDGSDRMLAQLRQKSGGTEIETVIGDYVDTRVPGVFSVVALLWNGILDDRGRESQLAIFRNAAAHLGPGGYFVVESFVLMDAQRSGSWCVSPRYVGSEHVELQLLRYDIATNQVERTLVHVRPDGVNFVSVLDTYASPGELDVMAEVTGFELAGRTAGWRGEPFTAASAWHVSAYRLVDPSISGADR